MGGRLAGRSAALAPAGAGGASFWRRWRVALFYRWRHGRWPRLADPRRFTEWVQWRKLNDRQPRLAWLTDKLHGKALAERRLGPAGVVPTLWSGRVLPARPPGPFPFIVKANHGCGQYLVVRNAVDYARARILAARWVARTYGAMLDEWHYRQARRLVLVEPLISAGERPIDYKVYVFNGRARIIQVHVGRGRAHRWTQFDRDWTPLSSDPVSVAAPARLAGLLRSAERMAGGETFVRVDFYLAGDRWLFGEFCLFPGSGLDRFRPAALDELLGTYWAGV